MIPCNICGSANSSVLSRHKLLIGPLLKCMECGLVRVDLSRGGDVVQDHQTGEERDKAFAREITIAQEKLHIKAKLESAEQKNRKFNFTGRLNLINREWSRPKENMRLLEVGCGEGFFLEQAKQYGYSVMGIEPNAQSSTRAREVFGLEVLTKTLAEAKIDRDSLDIIVSLHVIEHLLDPAAAVAEMRKILRKGGLLAIETPNIDSLPFKILGKRWRQFIPVHYYFFSKKTIAVLLERNGFVVSRIVDVGDRVSVQFFLNRLERMSPRPARLLSGIARSLRLEKKTFYVNPQDLMLVFARKAD
jgi:2-polyprenyl-3-methyl-5-hydroxy-6-metoxy-1,4-benzoquinol methylase